MVDSLTSTNHIPSFLCSRKLENKSKTLTIINLRYIVYTLWKLLKNYFWGQYRRNFYCFARELAFLMIQYNSLAFLMIQYNNLAFLMIQYNSLAFLMIHYNSLAFLMIQYNCLAFLMIQYNCLPWDHAVCNRQHDQPVGGWPIQVYKRLMVDW